MKTHTKERHQPLKPAIESWAKSPSALRHPGLWLLAVVAGAVLGLSLGRPEPGLGCGDCGGSINVKFLSAFTNDDGIVDSTSLDPNDNGIDPGYDKPVATCRAWVASVDKVKVEVLNGYPSYTCRGWTKVRNSGTSTVYYHGSDISAPSELTVREVTGSSCVRLKKGDGSLLSFTAHVEQAAGQMAVYTFEIKPLFKGSSCGW